MKTGPGLLKFRPQSGCSITLALLQTTSSLKVTLFEKWDASKTALKSLIKQKNEIWHGKPKEQGLACSKHLTDVCCDYRCTIGAGSEVSSFRTGFPTLFLLTLGPDPSCLSGGPLCVEGCLAASLIPCYQMPVALTLP